MYFLGLFMRLGYNKKCPQQCSNHDMCNIKFKSIYCTLSNKKVLYVQFKMNMFWSWHVLCKMWKHLLYTFLKGRKTKMVKFSQVQCQMWIHLITNLKLSQFSENVTIPLKKKEKRKQINIDAKGPKIVYKLKLQLVLQIKFYFKNTINHGHFECAI